MSEYTAEDYITFIETGRRDKISAKGLEVIAKKFRELESSETVNDGYSPTDDLDTSNPPNESGLHNSNDFDFWKAAYDFSEKICASKVLEQEYLNYLNSNNFSFNEKLLFRFSLKEAFAFRITCAELKYKCDKSNK